MSARALIFCVHYLLKTLASMIKVLTSEAGSEAGVYLFILSVRHVQLKLLRSLHKWQIRTAVHI